jgi:hypothetical protein
MGYIGIQSYHPTEYRELSLFYDYACNVFANTKNKKIGGYKAVFNQEGDFCVDCPLIIQIDNINYEISTSQDELISLTTNAIDLKEEIVWLEKDKWTWKNSGLTIMDNLIGRKINSISVIGLDYGDIGKAIHGILFNCTNDDNSFELLIRTNYDKITLLSIEDDKTEEPKIKLKCY